MKRDPKTFKVYKKDDRYYVEGLREDRYPDQDQLLMRSVPYPETETPEFDDPDDKQKMHSALYDMYQWHEALVEGDRFETPFGNYKCVSFHVVEDRG